MPRGGKRPNQTGRPPLPVGEKMVSRPIDMVPAMWEELDRLAKEHHQPRNVYIREMLQRAIDQSKS